MAQVDNEYRKNDINIEQLLIYNTKGNFVSLQATCIEFNMYFNLFDSGIEADFLISDTNALVDFIPVVGDETIVLTYKTPSFDTMREHVLRVVSISDREKVDRNEVYVIHAVSIETINDARKTVNQSYVGQFPHDIVNGIYQSHLKPIESDFQVVKKKYNVTTQKCRYQLPIIFTGESPYDAIEMICDEAIPAAGESGDVSDAGEQMKDGSSFLFFERADGWYFETLDSLLHSPPVEDFYLADASVEKDNSQGQVIHEYQNISTIDIDHQLDVMNNLDEGLYTNKVETIDPVFKIFREDTFNYSRDFKQLAHLEDHEFMGKDKTFKLKKDFDSDFLIPKDSYLTREEEGSTSTEYGISTLYVPDGDAGDLSSDPQLTYQRKIHEVQKYDNVARLKLESMVLTVTIPGNSDIQIGQVVNLHIPQSSQSDDFKNSLSRLYDKKFFITNVRHVYQKADNIYFTVLQCAKDTYAIKTDQIDAKAEQGASE
jgi:hypothetical protein